MERSIGGGDAPGMVQEDEDGARQGPLVDRRARVSGIMPMYLLFCGLQPDRSLREQRLERVADLARLRSPSTKVSRTP